MGSLYRMVNGVNPATFYILPMLGKHPDEYPRFRDCFAKVKDVNTEGIIILTRTGGGNRHEYTEENQAMKNMPGFIFDWDMPEDSTYAYWAFSVPEEWKANYELIISGRIKEISDAYVEQLIKVYPKLEEQFRQIKLV